MDERYVELAVDVPARRHVYIPVTQLPNYILAAQNAKQALYRSVYEFDEDIMNHIRLYRSTVGYNGRFFLRTLVIDIDRKERSGEEVLTHARLFWKHLANDWVDENQIRPAFSGRGFHLLIPDIFGFTPANTLPKLVEATMKKHFEDLDHSIYKYTGLIRVANTVNHKTGLFKIPLSAGEFFEKSYEQIEQLAKEPRYVEYEREEYTPEHQADIVVPVERPRTSVVSAEEDPSGIVTCLQRIYSTGGAEGKRHNQSLRLVAGWKSAGITRDGIRALLSRWAPSWPQEEVERSIHWVFSKDARRFRCDDQFMKEFCDPKCIFARYKNFGQGAESSADVEKRVATLIQSGFFQNALNLQEFYQLQNPYTIYRGEFVIVTGGTKRSKSAWVDSLAVELTNMKIIRVNTEMVDWLDWRRMVQAKHKITKEQAIQHYMLNTNTLSDDLGHMRFVHGMITLENLRRMIAEEKPDMVIIDTIEGIIPDPSKSDMAANTRIIMGLRDIAQSSKIILIAVMHIRKFGGKDARGQTRPLELEDVKGLSAAVQQADKIIGIEGEPTLSRRLVRSLAARDEGQLLLSLDFNYKTMTFTQVL